MSKTDSKIKKMIIFPNKEVFTSLKVGSVKNGLRIGNYVQFLTVKKERTDKLLAKINELTDSCDAKEKSLSLLVLKEIMDYRGSELSLIKKLKK